jgi:glucan phosphoethanolaminetransferase (alkaline phosphatase superfamily)
MKPWLPLSIVGALSILPFVTVLLWAWRAQPLRTLAALLVTTVLLMGLLAVCARTFRRLFLLAFPLWLIASIYAAYVVVVGKVPGSAVALVLAGASWEEITGLLRLWQQNWVLLPIAGLVALYLVLSARLPARPILSRATITAGRVLLVLIVPMSLFAAQNRVDLLAGITLNPAIGGILFVGVDLPRARAQLHGSLVEKKPFHARRSGTAEEVYVLVVGESARRASWSAYGYGRPTTPYLDRLKDKGEAIFLREAMADANLTTLAVPMMLTGLTARGATQEQNFGSNLFDLAKEAGYSTAWLVNQDVSVTTSLGIAPDHLDYPPDFNEGFFSRRTLDGILLPAYRREINRTGQARLIGMHVMGSHWEYYLRYPREFQHFGSAQRLALLTSTTTDRSMFADLVDAYDNSVLYTDWFLHEVIEGARGLSVPAAVIYFPDHGEASAQLDAGAVGHGASRYVPAEFEVPAFVWLNQAYRAAHPDKVAALEANASKEIRTHDVFYTMADLMQISWPAMPLQRSFASAQFESDTSREHLARGVLTVRP